MCKGAPSAKGKGQCHFSVNKKLSFHDSHLWQTPGGEVPTHGQCECLQLEGRREQNLGFLSETRARGKAEMNRKATTLDNVQKQEGLESLTDSASKSRVPPMTDT